MQLIDPLVFASEVLAAGEQLASVAELIRKYFGDCEATRFIQAYKAIDVSTAEDMIDHLALELAGDYDIDTTEALYRFVERFPSLNPELYGLVAGELFEYRKVTAIDRLYDQMKQIMEEG